VKVGNLPRLYVVMLRYRVAAMVALFLLLGAARESELELGWRHLLAALALASSYVSATALNDLADEEIDKVNHPRDAGRPLVEGWAGRQDLRLLCRLAALLALCLAVPLGGAAVALVGVALLMSEAYSAGPLRLSHRVAGAPLLLGVAYVVVPYGLGIEAAEGNLTHVASRLTGGLFLLFGARIVLKDFRDRAGDAQFGKPTLLLRFGKSATCALSLAALVTADGVLAVSLDPTLAVLLQPFVLAVGLMLWRLWRAAEPRAEQVAIGVGARMGNGLLLTMLAWLVMEGAGASAAEAFVVSTAVVAAFSLSFLSLAARPDEVLIGYKG
jgi:4-hydroxybenzoate polyprenyltransferase